MIFSCTSGPKEVLWADAESGNTGSSVLERGEVGVDQARGWLGIYSQCRRREARCENMDAGGAEDSGISGKSQVSGDDRGEASSEVDKRHEAERRRPSEARVRPDRSVVEDARALESAGGVRAWPTAI